MKWPICCLAVVRFASHKDEAQNKNIDSNCDWWTFPTEIVIYPLEMKWQVNYRLGAMELKGSWCITPAIESAGKTTVTKSS